MGMSWEVWDSTDLGSLTLPVSMGIPGMSWETWDSTDLESPTWARESKEYPWESPEFCGVGISQYTSLPGNPEDIPGL